MTTRTLIGITVGTLALAGGSVASYPVAASATKKKGIVPRCPRAHRATAKCGTPTPNSTPGVENASATLIVHVNGDGIHEEREYLRITRLETLKVTESPIDTVTETNARTVQLVPGTYQVAAVVWFAPTGVHVYRSETLTLTAGHDTEVTLTITLAPE